MKKIYKSIMLVAAAAMAFASCQKEENIAPETISATLTMHADVDATKTYLGESNTVLWGTGESVQLYVGSGESFKFVASASTDEYNGYASASFTFNIEDVDVAETYSLGGIYPASAAMSDNKKPKEFRTILPQTQSAEVGKYDPAAYIMVLEPKTVSELPSEYRASFRRATALNKITLTGVKEDITSVEITVPDGMALAGRRYFDLTSGESGEVYYDKSNTIIVNSNFTGSSIDVWFCSWGVELAAENELTVRMKNANKSFTRTIKANEKGIKFVEGDLNTLKIDMSSAKEESFDSFEGEWLITGTTSGTTYAAKAYSNGNNLGSPVQISVENDGTIYEVEGLANCKMTFTKITEGDYEGMYTIQDAGGKYLYAASSSGNQLKAGDTASSENYYWTVECQEGKYSIVASKSSNRNVMQFNPNNGSPIFSCYASASQTAVVLYPYSNVKADTTPKIVVSGGTSKNIGYEGGELTFEYDLKNLDGKTLNVAVSNSDMLSASAASNVLTVTVAANKGIAREATITLTCGEAAEVVLTITQDKYVEPGQGDGEQVSKSYVEMFSNYNNTSFTNSIKVSITGDACSWTGVGVTTAYWSNFTWGSYSKGVTFLKPGSVDAVYLESETLSGGITNLSIAAAANSTSGKIKVSVINVDNNNSETVLGTVSITSKKTKFTGSWTVTGISGNYKIKIYNNATAAYANVTDIQWNNN